MIAKAKSISHGIADLRYIKGEAESKKHPEKIFHVCDNLMPAGLDASGMYDSMSLDFGKHPKLKNSIIRIEISPAPEYTRRFTIADWEKLWHEFEEEFDRQQLRDAKGKVYSPKTNIRGSQSTVWLHLESDSKTPHLHAAVCRVDCNGRTNNDRNMHLRAINAANAICVRRGWKTAHEIHQEGLQEAKRVCEEILRAMPMFDLMDYFRRIQARGYAVGRNKGATVHGYSLKVGDHIRYKASEMGRNFTVKNLEAYWRRLHQGDKKPKTAAHRPAAKKRDYSVPSFASKPYTIEDRGQEHLFFIPDDAFADLEREFDWETVGNWKQLMDTAVALFVAMVVPPDDVSVSCGGGGSRNDSGWGRDPREEEREWMRRCMKAAVMIHGKRPRSRFKR